MKTQEFRFELLGLATFAGIVTLLAVPGLAPAAGQSPNATCALSFTGNISSLQLSPAGNWSLTSTSCTVTRLSQGTTSGTFTGTFNSGTMSIVTGTWIVAGSTSTVNAFGTGVSLSFSMDKSVDQMPVIGASYQGVISDANGSMLLATGIGGQVQFG